MNLKTHIIVHNSAISRNVNEKQFQTIDGYHKSKGWGGIGYHYLIEPDSTLERGREDDEIGAHCKAWMMNYRSIGICLSGNFNMEDPTLEQVKSLHSLITRLMSQYGIPEKNVRPHRHYTQTQCWGTRLPNDILGYLRARIANEDKPEWKKKLEEWAAEQGIKNVPLLLDGDIYSIIALIKRSIKNFKKAK